MRDQLVFVMSCCFLDVYLQAGGSFQRILYSLLMLLMSPLKSLNFGKTLLFFFLMNQTVFPNMCVCIKTEIAERFV